MFVNGLTFSEDDFLRDAAGAVAVDEMEGLLALGGGVGVGVETTGAGTTGASMFRFRCSSKPPTLSFNSATSVSSHTSVIRASKPFGNVVVGSGLLSVGTFLWLSSDFAVTVVSDVFAQDSINLPCLLGEDMNLAPFEESFRVNLVNLEKAILFVGITPGISIPDLTWEVVPTEWWKERRTTADSIWLAALNGENDEEIGDIRGKMENES